MALRSVMASLLAFTARASRRTGAGVVAVAVAVAVSNGLRSRGLARDSAGCVEHVADAGGDVQIEAGLDVAEVVAGDLADALEAVADGAAVDEERLGGRVVAAAAV